MEFKILSQHCIYSSSFTSIILFWNFFTCRTERSICHPKILRSFHFWTRLKQQNWIFSKKSGLKFSHYSVVNIVSQIRLNAVTKNRAARFTNSWNHDIKLENTNSTSILELFWECNKNLVLNTHKSLSSLAKSVCGFHVLKLMLMTC